MRIAIVGLGRMGMNMARRLLQGGHEVVAYNRTSQKTKELSSEGTIGAFSLEEIIEKLTPPRVVWLMLPAGKVVDDHIGELVKLLSADDVVVDGGNTYFKDDIRRSELLNKKDIHLIDAGVSGGIWGLKIGYCLMIGGDKAIFEYLEPVFKTLAPDNGYLYCGPIGSGHFVKMVHNGIEYGMMQAYGEGFEILESSPYADSFNYAEIAHLWNQGSVVRSWLLELAESAFKNDAKLEDIKGFIEESGEGRWTVEQAIGSKVPAPIIALSLMQRFRSQKEESFSDKVVAALRREFGGHSVKSSDKK